MSNRSSHFANRFQTMISAIRAAPLRVLFLAVAVAVVGLMTVTDLSSASPVHAQEQAVTATRNATGESPPARPTDLQASAKHDSVSLTWTASTDQTVTHYAVLRRDRDKADAGVFKVIDGNAGSATSYTDRSVSPEGSYVYRVKAVSPTGVSQWSSYARADIPADPEDLAPSGLSAKVVSGDDGVIEGVALAWDAPVTDAASVTGYEILRAVGDGDLATLVANTGSADTTYADDTATEAGESYAYRVKALRGEEASQLSDRAFVIIPKVTTLPVEPGIAEEQNVAVWSATLTVAEVTTDTDYGCANNVTDKECHTLLDDPEATVDDHIFTYNGRTYAIHALYTTADVLIIDFVEDLGTDADSFVLNAGGVILSFEDAIVVSTRSRYWLTNLTPWAVDAEVSLSIIVSSADAVSTDATLSALSLSGVTLSPGFAADTLTYTASVSNDVTSTKVTATANDDGATVAIVPADADDTADGHQVALAVGDTAVSVTVTAEDGTTTQTYAVTVTRADVVESAETTVPADWGLIPTDLGPGDSFRLIFIGSSETNANSSDIDVYNTFVQNLAAAGHDDIKAHSGTFRMLGSTEDVDARDNTGTTGTGVPIYWLGGAKVADDNADFYDGDWDEERTVALETGGGVTLPSVFWVWTGSAHNGTEAMSTDATPTSRALGNSNNAWVMQGSPNSSTSGHGPIQSATIGRTTSRGVYGLSGVFRVEGQAVAPAVSTVVVTSDPGDDDTYAIDDTIQVTVTFDQAVTVTGAPRIQLRVGGGEDEHLKWADYTSGSGNEALLFAYTVQADDFDDNGIYIAADELELNGGTIQSSDGTDAILDYLDQGTQSGHNVDGVRPTPQSAATSIYANSIIIIFSEPLAATTAPVSAFTLGVDTGTAPAVSTAAASGDMVTLGLASALTGDQVVTVTYTDATAGNDAAAVQDAVGNDADTFIQTVSNNVVGTPCPGGDSCYVVPADWGLIPSGLGAGAEFRLIFISSGTRNGSSSDIADYNTFVQTAAAAGHADIQDYSSGFRVVGSTADVDARDNTATTYTADDTGVAIYWLGGNKVVDDYEDFYDGGWDDEANAKDESGSNRSTTGTANYPLTGSNHNGTEAFDGSDSRALGAGNVQNGIPNSGLLGAGPLSSGSTFSNTAARPFYGLSPVFRVSGQVVTNTAPAFTTVANFSTNENQAATFQVTAMDPDAGDDVTYAITGGADLALFSINATSGLLAIPVSVDHENPADADSNNTYLVTVTATGGTGARALMTDQAITVTVTDVEEPPFVPATPTVSAVSGSSDSLSVTWTAPDNSGRPDIQSYDLQYRKGTTGNFADGPQDVTDTTTIIGGLDADSLYQVQVRATNDEGDSAWSSAGSGTTGAAAEAPVVLAFNQSDGTYAIEAKLSLSVVFSAEVTVSGTPQLALDIGGETRHADYESGTGTNLLLFSYIVAEGDEDTDGIGVPANSLALNGGTITAGGLAAKLTHGTYSFSAVLVDGIRPIFVSAETNEAGTRIFVTFSEPISAVNVNAVALSGGSLGLTLIEIDGAVVELDQTTDFAHDTTRTVSLSVAAVRDLAGNANASSSNNPITNNVLAVCGTLPTDRLWSACLTVGEISAGGRYGYQAIDSTGSLAPATFDVGTTTYTVTNLFDNDTLGGSTHVRINLAPAISEDDASSLTLHLGSTSFLFADASYLTLSGGSGHQWSRTAVLGWSEGDEIEVGITQEEQVNTAPSFLLESATREVAENSAAGVDVGGPVTATDTDTGDTLTYTLEGTDAASFTIDASSGQIQTKTGVTYDHELQPEYSVTVKADDGNGGTDTIAVTIDIADEDEPPSAPAAPTVSAVSGTTDSLEVTWTAPDNAGKPDIQSYDLQYRKGTTGNWIDGPQDVTVTTTIIGGLDADSLYQVQVRATNDEGDGGWSSPGSGSTDAPAEEMADTTVPADWSLIPTGLGPGDSFRLLFIGTSNTNASSSDIADYNTFVQNLVAMSGHADIKALSATFRMLGSTEDVDARDNTGTTGTGVPIYWLGGAKVADDYGDFYDGGWDEEATGARENGDSVSIGDTWKIWTGSAQDGTEAMSTGATPTSRALGNSNNAWVMQGSPNGSDSAHGPIESNTEGRGTNRGVYGLSGVFTVSDQPIPNDPPAFSSDESFSVEENQTDAGTVMAADPDAVDAVTYAVTGGADQAKFDIGASSGALTFKDAPDHENPTDAGGNNTYMVTVTATGGTGDRAMTAEQSITVTVTDVAETPAVDDLDVTSTPKADIDTYGREETIEVTVTFDQAVNVTGTPRIRLRIGGGMQEHYRWADYDGGTGTTALRFTYVVVEGDMDTDGIYILENELELNGGAIQGVDDDVAADLDYPRQGTQSGHKVDGSLKSDNTDPAFDQESAVRGLRENTGAGEYVGDPFTATDEDGDTLTYSLEGDDAGSFVINSRTGQILTREGVTYDHEVTTEYSVTVKADDGERGDATVEVAILVIDVNEPPLAPRAPTLSDGPDDSGSLDVTWKTPDNSGRPDIESYDLR